MNYEDRVTKEYLENAIANAGVKFETGSYVGNGQIGAEHPISLHFSFAPKIVWVYVNSLRVMFLPECDAAAVGNKSVIVNFQGTELSWYTTAQDTSAQLCNNGWTYYWLAIG